MIALCMLMRQVMFAGVTKRSLSAKIGPLRYSSFIIFTYGFTNCGAISLNVCQNAINLRAQKCASACHTTELRRLRL